MWQVLEETIAICSFEQKETVAKISKLNLKNSGRTVVCFLVKDRVIRILSTKEQTAAQLNKLFSEIYPTHEELEELVGPLPNWNLEV